MSLFAWWWRHAGGSLEDAGLLPERLAVRTSDLTATDQAIVWAGPPAALVQLTDGQPVRVNPMAERARLWIRDYNEQARWRDVRWSERELAELADFQGVLDDVTKQCGNDDGSGQGTGESRVHPANETGTSDVNGAGDR